MQILLAQATQPAASTSPAAGGTQPPPPEWLTFLGNPMFMIVLLLVVFFLFTTGGKRKEEKQRQAMLNQLKKGDRIQTIGGVLGTVVEARDNEVLVKVDESSNTKMRFTRSAIHRVIEEEKSENK
jgi:preprotein translocase subunit YajC